MTQSEECCFDKIWQRLQNFQNILSDYIFIDWHTNTYSIGTLHTVIIAYILFLAFVFRFACGPHSHKFHRYVTTKGSIMNSMTFTTEDDVGGDSATNDDRILMSAVNMCRTLNTSNSTASNQLSSDNTASTSSNHVTDATAPRPSAGKSSTHTHPRPHTAAIYFSI